MKLIKINKIFLILCLLLVTLTGCKDDNKPTAYIGNFELEQADAEELINAFNSIGIKYEFVQTETLYGSGWVDLKFVINGIEEHHYVYGHFGWVDNFVCDVAEPFFETLFNIMKKYYNYGYGLVGTGYESITKIELSKAFGYFGYFTGDVVDFETYVAGNDTTMGEVCEYFNLEVDEDIKDMNIRVFMLNAYGSLPKIFEKIEYQGYVIQYRLDSVGEPIFFIKPIND